MKIPSYGRTLHPHPAPRGHHVQRRGVRADPDRRVAPLALGAQFLVPRRAPRVSRGGGGAGRARARVLPDVVAGRSVRGCDDATADRRLDRAGDLLVLAALGGRSRVRRGVRVRGRAVYPRAAGDAGFERNALAQRVVNSVRPGRRPRSAGVEEAFRLRSPRELRSTRTDLRDRAVVKANGLAWFRPELTASNLPPLHASPSRHPASPAWPGCPTRSVRG